MEKIIFTKGEKREFDFLHVGFRKDGIYDIQDMLNEIAQNREDYPYLAEKLYENGSVKNDIEQQINFVKALDNPDNIVVQQEEEYLVKAVDDEYGYLNYDSENHVVSLTSKYQISDIITHFTKDRIEELAKEYNRPGFEIDKMERILVSEDDENE